MNIVLAGMPASGKTTVSAILGKLIGAEAIDTDKLIVEKYGEISGIFSEFGEEYFRKLETEAVKKACESKDAVISVGGGCLMKAENVKTLKESGKIVYLRASLKTLVLRAEGDNSRPLLFGGAEEKLKNLFMLRTPVFESASDITIDTDLLSAEETAKKIAELIK